MAWPVVRDAALEYSLTRGWQVFPADLSDGVKKSHKSAAYSDGANWGMTRDPIAIHRRRGIDDDVQAVQRRERRDRRVHDHRRGPVEADVDLFFVFVLPAEGSSAGGEQEGENRQRECPAG